jgi:signal transduction histidine kinase
MTLAVRLLVALGLVAVLVTGLVGLSARDVTRRHVEVVFAERIEQAVQGARGLVTREADTLRDLLVPLCSHDSFVDRTLVELERVGGRIEELPPGRGLALRELVPNQSKALRLDELALVTSDGTVLAASDPARVGAREPDLGGRLAEPTGAPRLRWRGREASLETHCSRGGKGVTLGLVGARRVAPMLERIGKSYGVRLWLTGSAAPPHEDPTLERRLRVEGIAGLEVTAAISRQPLAEALAQIDASILLSGGIAVLLSVALAVLMARTLSRPIVLLARETRQILGGGARPVRGRGGGRELEELADSFNRAIVELGAVRRRLARTERIAARREVARQVAHEIKNPLAPIRAAVETLRRLRARGAAEFDGYFDEATRTVLEEVQRIKNIVSEFTKFARMPPPRFARIDLEELARGVVALHDTRGDPGRAPVRLEVTRPLPAVLADRDQIVQVLTNLLQNALEAAATVRDDARVTVSLASAELGGARAGAVVLRVSDNGPGIDPRIRDRLFEPYATTKPEGSGLGLAIVQTIVHEHGGEIRFESSPNEGTVFDVLLPIDGPSLLEKAPQVTAPEGDAPVATTGSEPVRRSEPPRGGPTSALAALALAVTLATTTGGCSSTPEPAVPKRKAPPLQPVAAAPERLEPQGLDAVVVADLETPPLQALLAQTADQALAVLQTEGRWLARALRFGGARAPAAQAGALHDLGAAPAAPVPAALRPARGGWLFAWLEAAGGSGARPMARSIAADGAPRGEPRALGAASDARAIALAVAAGRSIAIWETARGDGAAELWSASCDPPGPATRLGAAEAWDVAETPAGPALAWIAPAGEGPDRVGIALLGASGRAEATLRIPAPSAQPDVDLAAIGERLFVGWTDERDDDPHAFVASVRATAGKLAVEAGPRPAEAVGAQALVALRASEGGALLLAWEGLPGSRGPRAIDLAVLEPSGVAGERRARMFFHGDGDPHIVPDGDGFAALTLAPMLAPSEEGGAAGAGASGEPQPVPTYARLDRGLALRGAEPLRLATLASESDKASALHQNGVPEVTHAIDCAAGRCAALVGGGARPGRVALALLPARPSPWQPPLAPLALRTRGTATALDSIVRSGEPIAEMTAVEIAGGRTLVAWLTHFEGGPPGQGPGLPGATLALVIIEADGRVGETKLLSSRAISVGGLAAVALPTRGQRGEPVAAIAWAGPADGASQLFVTQVGERGDKLRQRAVTKVRRPQGKGAVPNEVLDVALVASERDILCAWSDTRDGEPAVFVARLGRALEKSEVERRVSRPGTIALEPTLGVARDRVVVAWSERTAARPHGDVTVARLHPSSLEPLGPPEVPDATELHARTPELAPAGEGLVLSWIDEPLAGAQAGREARAQAVVVRLDATGAVARSGVLRLGDDERQIVSATVRCRAEHCRGVLAASGSDDLVLRSFEAAADGAPRIHAAARLAGRSAHDVSLTSPSEEASTVFFAATSRGATRLRRLRLRW